MKAPDREKGAYATALEKAQLSTVLGVVQLEQSDGEESSNH